ncbi:hypothetical protein HGI30_12620 [Paenibacillus albicereus]|uniref:Lon proteolytic domain-containing protein n=2 Tax=Paenibacillus albicereus TaxID=2726185 RepID=A0A6H2H3U8_9BACL|nr:hypothetical protein HGI30_12620 [Paenibacillus albicereus]
MDEAMRQALLEAARAAAGEAERGWIEEIREETPEPERGAPRSEPDSRPIGRVVGDGSSEPIRLGPAGAGGPSAGLMAALSLYDRLTPEADLLGGRRIAGTGTMDAEGRIGAVGGVGRKAEAASAAGADLFVAPKAEAGEAAEAARRAGGGMMIVGADSLGEAVDLLRQR